MARSKWSPAHFGYILNDEDKDLSFNADDSAKGDAEVHRGRSQRL